MDSAVELLSKLIAIPSVNPMGGPVDEKIHLEWRMTDFLEKYLSGRGLELRRQPVSPGRENLLAAYHSSTSKKHVLLEVHQDTVPVDNMTVPPFEGMVRDGNVYGRGACDNKGPMTSMLGALCRLAREKPAGAASTTLALTVDEEFTFTGASEFARQGMSYDGAIVAEPTELNLIVAHKGIVRWILDVHGRACHSSNPKLGVNAIYGMAKVLAAIEEFGEALQETPQDPWVGGPTLSVGKIGGGVAVNIVPEECWIDIDRRLIPGESASSAYAAINDHIRKRVGDSVRFSSRKPWSELEPLEEAAGRELAARFGRSVRAIRGDYKTTGVPFGTDAAVYARVGVPCVVFGPGSIDQAHTADEFVPIDEVEQAAEIYFHYCVEAGKGD